MTWPQYQRRECSYKGWRTHLTPQEAEVLLVLLLRGECPTPRTMLIDVLWGDDPDGGPVVGVKNVIQGLRAKLPGMLHGGPQFGWFLNQFYMEKQ